jgi:hypothetical protein
MIAKKRLLYDGKHYIVVGASANDCPPRIESPPKLVLNKSTASRLLQSEYRERDDENYQVRAERYNRARESAVRKVDQESNQVHERSCVSALVGGERASSRDYFLR